jgi:hypothetical protein
MHQANKKKKKDIQIQSQNKPLYNNILYIVILRGEVIIFHIVVKLQEQFAFLSIQFLY